MKKMKVLTTLSLGALVLGTLIFSRFNFDAFKSSRMTTADSKIPVSLNTVNFSGLTAGTDYDVNTALTVLKEKSTDAAIVAEVNAITNVASSNDSLSVDHGSMVITAIDAIASLKISGENLARLTVNDQSLDAGSVVFTEATDVLNIATTDVVKISMIEMIGCNPNRTVGTWVGTDDMAGENVRLVINKDGSLQYEGYSDYGSSEVTLAMEFSHISNDSHVFTDTDGYSIEISHYIATDTIDIYSDDFAIYVYDLERHIVPVVIPVASVSLIAAGVTELEVGESSQVSASVMPVNATNSSVVYSSTNVGVVTVSSTGVVTAIGVGTAEVKATAANGVVSNSITYTVIEAGIVPVLSGDILGDWWCEMDYSVLFEEVFVTISADGVLIFDVPASSSTWYDKVAFNFVSQEGDTYTFINDGAELICTLVDPDTLEVVWPDEYIEMIVDYGCPMVRI